MLSDDDVLAAVRHRLGEGGAAFPAEGVRITRHLLVDGRIVRCVETRTERPGFHKGPVDLSGRPEYDGDLRRHPVPAPEDTTARTTLELVRHGTVDDRACDCGNGKAHCRRCEGTGELACRPYVPCGTCKGIDPCLRCDGTGRRTRGPVEPPEEEKDGRVACRKCGAPDAACATCKGRGRVQCPKCDGSASVPCPDCGRAGTVRHDYCGGTGRVVSWTEGIVDRRPVEDPIEEYASLPRRVRRRARGRGDWAHLRVDAAEAAPPDGTAKELVAFLEPRLQRREDEIARRIDLRHLTLARVTHPAHPHRVYFVLPEAGASGPSGAPGALGVVTTASPRRNRQYAGAALLALALLAALSWLLA
ncbi:hypothetical protein AB0E83_02985 [Streptomyces sp. NPDC035033]|uniref:hypothetical protein n=1 Tax=Streptomyces sp. NPDC035033 TaxID=3155368 RepID=UPI0033C9C5C2